MPADFLDISRYIHWKQWSQKYMYGSLFGAFVLLLFYPLVFVVVFEITTGITLFLVYRWAWNHIVRDGVEFYLSASTEQRRQLERRFTDQELRRFLMVVDFARNTDQI